MRLNLADLTLVDVKFNELSDNAVARGPDAEAEVAGRSGIVGDLGA